MSLRLDHEVKKSFFRDPTRAPSPDTNWNSALWLSLQNLFATLNTVRILSWERLPRRSPKFSEAGLCIIFANISFTHCKVGLCLLHHNVNQTKVVTWLKERKCESLGPKCKSKDAELIYAFMYKDQCDTMRFVHTEAYA